MNFASPASIFVAAPLLFAVRDDCGNRQALAAAINGNEGEVGGTHVVASVLVVILDKYFYPDLHRRMENSVDRRTQDDEVADTYREEKIQMVDRSSDNVLPGVTVCRQGSSEIDPVHQASPEQSAKRVGIVREDNFRHLGLRIPDWPWEKREIGVVHDQLAPIAVVSTVPLRRK